jgi:hypothetical protein
VVVVKRRLLCGIGAKVKVRMEIVIPGGNLAAPVMGMRETHSLENEHG